MKRRRMRSSPCLKWGGKKKKRKNLPLASRTGAAAECSHHGETELESEQHRRPFHRASSRTSNELEWELTSTVRLVLRCPQRPVLLLKMSVGSDFGNPLRKFKLVFLGEQSGKRRFIPPRSSFSFVCQVNSLHLLPSQQVHFVETRTFS